MYAFRVVSKIDTFGNLFSFFNFFLFSIQLSQFFLECFQVNLAVTLERGSDFFFTASDFRKSLIHSCLLFS